MNRLLFFIVLSAFCSLPATAADLDKTILLDGLQRQYIIHLPPGFNNTGKWPVIFALHGGGGNYKNTISFYNLNGLADEHGYIIVYPNAVNKSWSMKGVSSKVRGNSQDIDDVKFISVLMDTLIAGYHADPRRFFCTGISRGGIFSLFLAGKLSERIRAIAPVCASLPQSVIGDYHFQHPTPVLLINGTADPLISYTGGKGRFNTSGGTADEYDMLPTEDLVRKINELNNCAAQPAMTDMPNTDRNDGCTAVKYTYTCNAATVEFIKISNGGHTWPGGSQYLPKMIIGKVCKDFKAEEEVFRFFETMQ